MNNKINFRISDELLLKGNSDSESRGMNLSEHIRDLLESYKNGDDLSSKENKVSKKASNDIVGGSGWQKRLEEQIQEAKNKKSTASGK